MDQNAYRNLVAGTDCRICKRALRLALKAIACCYTAAIRLRNWLYNKQILKSHKVGAIVISIGNVTTGGTGKTPLVIWLCNYLNSKPAKCAILTRGYKAEQGKLTDEPAILAKSCGDARVIVNSDRVHGAQKAITESNAKILIMDDGFQHRRLNRDLDIVAIDATCPFGYGKVLPAGLLREPLNGLKRAQAVVITRYEQAQPEKTYNVVEQIKKINPDIVIAKAVHEHPYAMMMKGQKISIEELKQKKILAYCGIGNPAAFLNNLEKLGLDVADHKIYNDHHDYTADDISDIYEEAKYLKADIVLSTEKDWVKTALLARQNDDIVFAYLAMQLNFVEGSEELKQLIDRTVENAQGQTDA